MSKNKYIGVAISLLVVTFFMIGGFNYFSPGGPSINNALKGDVNNQINQMNTKDFSLQSPAFKNGGFIPSKYSCDGLNMSPPLIISNVPSGTMSLVLIADDPDVPKEVKSDGVFDHWVVFNIDPSTTYINEGQLFGSHGNNGRGERKYTGPCPPTQFQPTTHRYFFRIYATDLPSINFAKIPTKSDVLGAIQSNVIEEATLMGLYDRAMRAVENE